MKDPPGPKAATESKHTSDTHDFSDVEEFVARQEQQSQWDSMSRYAAPNLTLIAFRTSAISLIFAAAFIIVGLSRKVIGRAG